MKLIEMLTLPVKASVIAFAIAVVAAPAFAIIDTTATSRDASYTTGSIMMKNATTPILNNVYTRDRVNAANAGGTYEITMPTTNVLGALWFYLGSSTLTGDVDMTFDGRGSIFGQYATEPGQILNDVYNDPGAATHTSADSFVINAFSYFPMISFAGVSCSASTKETYYFSNTVMRLSARQNFDCSWGFEGGFVSFDGPSGRGGNAGYLYFPQQDRDSNFRLDLDEAETHVPGITYAGKYRDSVIRVNGGTLSNSGALAFSNSGTPTLAGTNLLEIVNGAKVTQKGAFEMGIAAKKDLRTERIAVQGEGSELVLGGNLNTLGHSVWEVTDGARLAGTVSETAHNLYFGYRSGTYGAGDSTLELLVSGKGSTFDFEGPWSFYVYGGGSKITFSDGAQVLLPNTIFIGSSDGGDVTVDISGGDTRVEFTNPTVGSQVYFGLGGLCTVNMSGGFLGHRDEVPYYLRLGHQPNSTGVFNMVGGQVVVPGTGNSALDIGLSGDATFNLSGGEVIVSNAVNLGYTANMTSRKDALLNITGGRLYNYGAVSICAGSDTEYRYAEVRLDGGELITDGIAGSFTKLAGKKGTGIVTANGGTIKPRQTRPNAAYPWSRNIDKVALGPKGLTVDTDGFTIRSLQQVFTNKDGEEGVLIKAGDGQLTMQDITSYDVARTVVRRGTLFFDVDETVTLDTTLALEGGTVSLVGATSTKNLVVAAIEGGDGELYVDPTDTITVTGEGSDLEGLKIRFSSDPAAGAAIGVLKFEQPLTEGQKTALRRAYCSNPAADGYHNRFTYDEQTGVVTFEVAQDVPIDEAANVTWQGADGDWAKADNWAPSAPGLTNRAIFAENGAEHEVLVGADAIAGALRFEGTGFTIAADGEDGRLEVAAERGAAEIAVADGMATEISADMLFDDVVALPTGTDAALTLSGDIAGGGVKKSGKGVAALGGDNSFATEVLAAGGILDLTHSNAVAGAQQVIAVADTIRFDAEGLSVGKLAINEVGTDLPVVFDVREDACVKRIDATAGGFLKRGTGTLTVDASGETAAMTLTTMKGGGTNCRPESRGPAAFPDDGSAPPQMSGGLTVAEGDVVIKGSPSTPEIKVPGTIVVGVNITNVNAAAQPSLTFDGVKVDNWTSAPGHLLIGYGGGEVGSKQVSPRFCVNNSTLKLDTMRMGLNAGNAYTGFHPVFAATNSTVIFAWQGLFAESSVAANGSVLRLKDVTTWSINSTFSLHGPIDAIFDNCRIGKSTGWTGIQDDKLLSFGLYDYSVSSPTGRVELVNGTVANVSLPNYYVVTKDYVLLWDDSEWNYGRTADFTYEYPSRSEFFHFTVRGKGLILRPEAGTTFTTKVPFEGEGGVQNLGAGTVKFAADTYRFTGDCYAAAGAAFDFSAAGAAVRPRIKGPGSFTGCPANGVTVVAETADDWTGAEVPVLDGVAAGRLTVDFARTAENPLSEDLPTGLVVAKLVNGATLNGIRLKNTGLRNKHGVFSVNADGEVVMNVVECGLMMIVR